MVKLRKSWTISCRVANLSQDAKLKSGFENWDFSFWNFCVKTAYLHFCVSRSGRQKLPDNLPGQALLDSTHPAGQPRPDLPCQTQPTWHLWCNRKGKKVKMLIQVILFTNGTFTWQLNVQFTALPWVLYVKSMLTLTDYMANIFYLRIICTLLVLEGHYSEYRDKLIFVRIKLP